MRIFLGMLAIALLAAWGPVTPASAQPCEPSNCWLYNLFHPQSAKAKPAPTVAKKAKKPAKEEYMKAAS